MPNIDLAAGNELVAPALQARSRRSLERITTAAELILRREGPDGFSVAAVAEVSGISVGGIYARVKGKRELFDLVKLSATARLVEKIKARLKSCTDNPEQVISGFLDALCAEFARNESLHRALFSPGLTSLLSHQHGRDNRKRSLTIFAEAMVVAHPDLATVEMRDVELIADMPISYLIKSLSEPPEDLDWAWIETSLRMTAMAHYEALVKKL